MRAISCAKSRLSERTKVNFRTHYLETSPIATTVTSIFCQLSRVKSKICATVNLVLVKSSMALASGRVHSKTSCRVFTISKRVWTKIGILRGNCNSKILKRKSHLQICRSWSYSHETKNQLSFWLKYYSFT